MMLAWTFHSMVWPYLTLFASERLDLPLTNVTLLISIHSAVGLVATFIGGAIADRFGRKWVMAFSMLVCAVAWFFFQLAGAYPLLALLMAVMGATTPLYRLAADAMIADLIPAEDRIDAYSVIRLGNNLGVAVGPAIGGFLAAVSYNISFSVVGIGLFATGLIVAIFSIETMPKQSTQLVERERTIQSYAPAFKDHAFIRMLISFTFNRIGSSILWILLAVYAKQNFGLSEKLYGFIPVTNAVMVILFQIAVTRWTKKRAPAMSMAVGAMFYSVAVFLVAFGHGFWMFWVCMVIATIGEMVLLPTSTTFVSRQAPEDMRARYMSLYTLTWGVGTLVGPLIGGMLADLVSPAATWIGGGIISSIGALMFLWNHKNDRKIDLKDNGPSKRDMVEEGLVDA
jgi:predicted MFS family arabinose efflux permease